MAGFVAPIVSGVAGLLGGLFPPTTKTSSSQSQQGSTEQNQQGQTSGTTTPNLSPFQQQLAGLFTQGASNLYGQSQNLTPYTTSGLQGIQGQGSANNQILQNLMASRGLSYSPAGAQAQVQNTLNTGNQANTFLSQIPLLQRQLQQQSLQQLIGAFGALPTGVSSTGSSIQTGSGSTQSSGQGQSTTQGSGNPAAGAVGGFGAGLFAPQPGGSSFSQLFGPGGTFAPSAIPGNSQGFTIGGNYNTPGAPGYGQGG